ncbi:MAG TPA: hypothetical protein VFA97_13805 [Gaiellaceae bacterium]|nr:hypothetical protein [Gaiellaceae bacterium]
MTLARVVVFDGVDADRATDMQRELRENDLPEGLPATELMLLHDVEAERAMAIVFFDTEDDYRKGHEILDAMPASDTPGKRASVTRYDVVVRRSAT